MRLFTDIAFIVVSLYIVFIFYQSYQFNKAAKLKANEPFLKPSDNNKLNNFVQVIAVVIFVVFMIRCEYSDYEKGPSKTDFTWNDALLMCQTTIKNFARDPDTAEVPYVPNGGKGNEYYYAWGAGTKSVRMRNGLGLEVPVSAYCIVDGNTKTITQLSIDGKTIK